MQVNTLIQSDATLVRVVSVKAGDRYKRLDKPSYGEPRIVFGQITDVMADGDHTALAAIEFAAPSSYASGIMPTTKAFAGDTDVALFTCTEEEWTVAMNEAMESQRRAVDVAERDLAAKRLVMDVLTLAAEAPTTAPEVITIRPDAIEG